MTAAPLAGRVVPTEHAEQCATVAWAALMAARYPALALLYAIANGGHRHIAVAAKLKAAGVKRGVPDLCLPVARGQWHGLYVELKRVRGGSGDRVVRAAQEGWHAALRAEGYCVAVCKGAEAAQRVLLAYVTGALTTTPTERPTDGD